MRWLDRGGALWERMSRGLVEGMAPNTLVVTRPDDSDQRAGLRGQAYGIGNFHCAPEEAVIVRFTPPRCHHWSVSLANWWWESMDFAERQTSLNGRQARLDADGAFRGVIAQVDPGVPNWLDPTGYPRGTLALRFLLADEAPKVELERLPLAQLAAKLPGGHAARLAGRARGEPRAAPPRRAAPLSRVGSARAWRGYLAGRASRARPSPSPSSGSAGWFSRSSASRCFGSSRRTPGSARSGRSTWCISPFASTCG